MSAAQTIERVRAIFADAYSLQAEVSSGALELFDPADDPAFGACLGLDWDRSMGEWHISVSQGRKSYGLGPFGPLTRPAELFREMVGAARRESDLIA